MQAASYRNAIGCLRLYAERIQTLAIEVDQAGGPVSGEAMDAIAQECFPAVGSTLDLDVLGNVAATLQTKLHKSNGFEMIRTPSFWDAGVLPTYRSLIYLGVLAGCVAYGVNTNRLRSAQYDGDKIYGALLANEEACNGVALTVIETDELFGEVSRSIIVEAYARIGWDLQLPQGVQLLNTIMLRAVALGVLFVRASK